jgi:signal transduction histidine kinase
MARLETDAAKARHDLAAAELRHADEQAATRAERNEAVRLNAAKTRLLATVGHDLRQPLTVIVGTLETLTARADDPRDQRRLATATAAAARLERALELLAESAQTEMKSLSPRPRAVAVNALFDELRDQHEAAARRKSLTFRIVPCRRWITSDPELLGSILHNLVGNAIKYTRLGGGVLVGGRTRRMGEDDRVLLQVWDTGIGIEADMLDAIFDERTRLAPAEASGFGLGLPIARRAAELLGHELTVRSAAGQGSCFTVSLPIATAVIG